MKNRFVIITNNPRVRELYGAEYPVDYEEQSFVDTLKRARDRIYAGHRLLTHPLSGSVKPGETPYKSLMITADTGELDMNSVQLIESAIQTCGKFRIRAEEYRPEVFEDFQLVDSTLLESAMGSVGYWT